MACWELGIQLNRDWLPETEKANVKLFVVGIGSGESAKEFAEQLGLPAEIVFGDEEAESYKNLRFVNSDFSEDGRKRGMRMMTERTAEAVKSRANGRPVSFCFLHQRRLGDGQGDLQTADAAGRQRLGQNLGPRRCSGLQRAAAGVQTP